MLILSCDPDEAKKKQPNTQDQDDNNDNNNKQPVTPPTQTNKPTPKPPIISKIPVKFLDAVGIDSGNPKDANATVWVFQDKEITFSTTAKDKSDNPIANALFTWEWRKRGQDTDRGFGKSWTVIKSQTTATATLRIPTDERVGAYELRVSATSGGQTVNNHNKRPYKKFTVRKSGCPAPNTKNAPANFTALQRMVTGSNVLTNDELEAIQALDTSKLKIMSTLFFSRSFDTRLQINCWDVSNVTKMGLMLSGTSFNQNIGDWDVSNVTDMGGMFNSASAFNNGDNANIGHWDTSKVINMATMFANNPFNQDIGDWDVSEVTDMSAMFASNTAFNHDLSRWVVKQIPRSRSANFDHTTNAAWTKARKPNFPK